jgi:hypothetical protein
MRLNVMSAIGAGTLASASRAGLTPSPTCQPGQGGIPQGDAATSATNPVARTVSPPRIKPMEGFFMSKEPKDTAQQSESNANKPRASQPDSQVEPTASKETTREKYMKTISENPRWSEAKPSGQGFVIGGARSREAARGTCAE